jgi:hypothetical protein
VRPVTLEGKSAIPVYLVLKPFLPYRLRHYVNLGPENLRKSSFQLFETPEVIEATRGETFAEADRDIDISESGPASSRATEPNSDKRTTPASLSACSWARSVAMICSWFILALSFLPGQGFGPVNQPPGPQRNGSTVALWQPRNRNA